MNCAAMEINSVEVYIREKNWGGNSPLKFWNLPGEKCAEHRNVYHIMLVQ